ncbi:RagB/SusD family nutrient uptake outer membrane protein [Draconibacterium sp.]|uniref:RagB/SusD family nutrient uptake outer membrane protein n=1 Tax=Draconibacterium sp. TaxID=1965318 RepID=UPI0035626FE3
MKHLKIFSLLLIVLGIFACTDLQEDPVGELAPDGFFKKTGDVEAAIFGAYGRMASEGYWGRKQSLTIMLLSDMVDIGDPGTPSRRKQINSFTSDAFSGMVSSFWPRSYDIISAANNAIYGAEVIEADEDVKNALKAEAMFARSFIYFNLVRLFGDIPYIGESISDPEAVADLLKTSAADVYGYIIADLEFGKQHLPMTQNARARASAGAAATMLADVYLTLGDYSKAYENAKWVIDHATDLEYELEADYQNLFDGSKQDNLKEPIYVIDFLGQQAGGSSEGDDLFGPLTGIRGSDMQGWGVAVPSMAVYESWDDRDYRKSVAFDAETTKGGVTIPYTEFNNEKRPHIAKYTRFPGTADLNNRYTDFNYAIYRYADVLLMAAEAGNEVSGPNAELIGYVNQVRARARNAAGVMNDFPADVQAGLSKDEFRDLILEERRLELSFELKRWWDIKRRQLGDEVFKGASSLEPHENFNAARDYLLALPQIDLDRNPNLLPQNPGY